MINVSALHQHASAFQSHGRAVLSLLERDRKRGEEETNEQGNDSGKPPVLDPHIFPPDPVAARVSAQRRQEFGEAAQRLAQHADERVAEMRANRNRRK